MSINTVLEVIKVKRIRDYEMLCPKWGIHIMPFPQSSEIIAEQGENKTIRARGSVWR